MVNITVLCSHVGIHQWLLNYTFYCHMGDFSETDQTLHLNQKNRRGKKHTLCIQNTEDILDFMNTPTCYGNGGGGTVGTMKIVKNSLWLRRAGMQKWGRRLLFNLIFIRISDCFSLFIYIDTIPS